MNIQYAIQLWSQNGSITHAQLKAHSTTANFLFLGNDYNPVTTVSIPWLNVNRHASWHFGWVLGLAASLTSKNYL